MARTPKSRLMLSLPVDVATALRATADWAQVAVSELIAEAVALARVGKTGTIRRAQPIDHAADLWQDVAQDGTRGTPLSLVNITLAADQREWVQQHVEKSGEGSGALLVPWISKVLCGWLPGFGIAGGERFAVVEQRYGQVGKDGGPVSEGSASDKRSEAGIAHAVADHLAAADSLSDIPDALSDLARSGVDLGAVATRLLMTGQACSQGLIFAAVPPLLITGHFERVVHLLHRLEKNGHLRVEREPATGVPRRLAH